MKKLILLLLCAQSCICCFAQTKFQIESLKTFTKAYGYVKYFHPSDEAASIDWDQFAIYGAGQVEKCRTPEELLQTLNHLFLPFAPTARFYNTGENVKFDISTITPAKPRKYKPVYWQHQGVSFGMKNISRGTYTSIRVNRKTLVDMSSPSSFGNVMTYLYPTAFIGKPVKFTAKVKLLEGSTGTGHLWLRVDNNGNDLGFFDNMDDRPITGHSWEQYEIKGNVDLSAEGIAMGCFLHGSGTLLMDDLHLYYMNDNEWIEVPIHNSGFESGDIGDRHQWFYRGEDYKISKTEKDVFEGRSAVRIQKTNTIVTLQGKSIFYKSPAIGEYISKDIGSGISCMIPLTLYGDKNSTYPQADQTTLKTLSNNINNKDTALGLRLGDVIITWNVFQHFYPYFDVVRIEWEEELEKAFMKCYKDTNSQDFQNTLEQLTAPLKDGHINVYNPNSSQIYQPRICWEFIENKLVITKLCQWDMGLMVGDVVTRINGESPEVYFARFENRISAATPGWMNYRLATRSLSGELNSTMNIVVNEKKVELTRNMKMNDDGCDNSVSAKKIPYEFMGGGIIYLNLDLIEMKTIDSLLPHLEKARSIICDLRGYPNSNHDFISYLMNKPDHDLWMFIPQFIYPDRENIAGFQSFGWNMKPESPHLKAKIIFIIDGSAISYAESYMGFIEGYGLATIVGQPTAGTNGNINPFMLPGGYYISWTGMKVLKHDGSQQHGIGITPNVYVNKTIQGVIEGRDEFLEKAIELAKAP